MVITRTLYGASMISVTWGADERHVAHCTNLCPGGSAELHVCLWPPAGGTGLDDRARPVADIPLDVDTDKIDWGPNRMIPAAGVALWIV